MVVSSEQKRSYKERVKPYKRHVDSLKQQISDLKLAARRNSLLEPYLLLKMAALILARANTFILMSRLSERIQNFKHDNYLNEARKDISSMATELLRIFKGSIDDTLTENQENLLGIERFSPQQKLSFLRESISSANEIRNAMGESSKWRWSFPDIYFKLILLGKNLCDFQQYEQSKDPQNESWFPHRNYVQFLMEEARNAAQELRSKYELGNREVADLHLIKKIFEFQRRVYIIMKDQQEQERIQISLHSIQKKIEALLAEKGEKAGQQANPRQ